MTASQEAQSYRSAACTDARDKAYLAAYALKVSAFEAAVGAAKAAYYSFLGNIPSTASDREKESAKLHAAKNAKCLAEQGYALAEVIYNASLAKADAEYQACLLPSKGSQSQAELSA